MSTLGLAAAAFGTGAALASVPGPVQVVIVTEATHGGIHRSFRALMGAAITFATLLGLFALGVSIAAPISTGMRLLEVAGGSMLLWLAWNGHRNSPDTTEGSPTGTSAPELRGALSVAVNPGAWLFLAVVAAPMFATATASAGVVAALLVAAALSAGAAAGDSLIVLAGGLGLPRLSDRTRQRITLILHLLLAGFGLWLIVGGVHALTTGT